MSNMNLRQRSVTSQKILIGDVGLSSRVTFREPSHSTVIPQCPLIKYASAKSLIEKSRSMSIGESKLPIPRHITPQQTTLITKNAWQVNPFSQKLNMMTSTQIPLKRRSVDVNLGALVSR